MHQDQEKRIFNLNQRKGRKECHLVEGEKQGDRGEVQATRSRRTQSGRSRRSRSGNEIKEDEQRIRETRRSRRTRSGGGRAAYSFRKKQTFRKSTFELLENRVKDELEVKCQETLGTRMLVVDGEQDL